MNSSKERKNAIKKLRSFVFTPKSDIAEFREKIDGAFSSVFLPNRVDFAEKDYNGVMCDVLSPAMFSKKRVLLYVHGGAFVAGSRKAYRPFVSSLANAVSCRAVVPEFKLAPSHPFPYALEDLQNVFRLLYAQERVRNGNPEIIVAADSSGASIAVALILSLKDKFRASVAQMILFSPWLDFSPKNEIFSARRTADAVFSPEAIRFAVENYADSSKNDNPLVSPLRASQEMLSGFPPVFIQCGEKEIFLESAKQFKLNLIAAGSECTLDVWEGMMPLFQLADDCLNESHLAVERIGKLLTEQSHSDESEYNIGLPLE